MKTIDCAGIDVTHADHLDGGGPRSWPHYVEAARTRIGPVERAFEWCAGPGYIGFALLGSGLCTHLTLADINPDAVEAARLTVRRQGLEDRVTVFQSDNLRDIPESEQWDLVVGDPPHFPVALERHIERGFVLRSVDADWRLHRAFFAGIRRHLRPGGRMLITESMVAGEEHIPFFERLLAENNLVLVETPWRIEKITRYFLFIARAEDASAMAGGARPTVATTTGAAIDCPAGGGAIIP